MKEGSKSINDTLANERRKMDEERWNNYNEKFDKYTKKFDDHVLEEFELRDKLVSGQQELKTDIAVLESKVNDNKKNIREIIKINRDRNKELFAKMEAGKDILSNKIETTKDDLRKDIQQNTITNAKNSARQVIYNVLATTGVMGIFFLILKFLVK